MKVTEEAIEAAMAAFNDRLERNGIYVEGDWRPEITSALEAAMPHMPQGDEYHSLEELYEYRLLYNAHAANGWHQQGIPVVKSWRHSDGEPCFGGGWFIVTAQLPTGQVSNHYPAKDWDLFQIPFAERPPAWDGHTPQDAADRLRKSLLEGDDTTSPSQTVEPQGSQTPVGVVWLSVGSVPTYTLVPHIN